MKSRQIRRISGLRYRGLTPKVGPCLALYGVASLFVDPLLVYPQDALQLFLSVQSAIAQQHADLQDLPHTTSWRGLTFRPSASVANEWNANINLVSSHPQEDFILRPLANLDLFWPVTKMNHLTFSVGAGYELFLQHAQYSRAIVSPGSVIEFDVFIKQWRLNFHDQFSYEQDPTTWGAISGIADYGGFYNNGGLMASWNLHNTVLFFGYDHLIFVSSSDRYDYLSRASDFAEFRAAVKLHPAATAGLDLTGGPTTYKERLMGENITESVGVFVDWRMTQHTKLLSRTGYYNYTFWNKESGSGNTDRPGGYFCLNISHQPRERITYSLEGGREAFFGDNSALTEQWYGKVTADWLIFRHILVSTAFRYDIATQPIAYPFNENYDRAYASVRLSWPMKRNLTMSCMYRYYIKSADLSLMDYEQQRLTLQMACMF